MTLAHTCRNTLEEWSQQRKLLKLKNFTQWQHIWIKIQLVRRLLIRTKILNKCKLLNIGNSNKPV